jgi:hypothetical protein
MLLVFNLRVLISVMLLTAGGAKVPALHTFHDTVMRFKVSDAAARRFALAIPVAELLVGATLWIVGWYPWPEVATAVLGVGFVAANTWAIRHDLDASCGCFGAVADEPFGPWSLGRAISVCLGGIILIIAHPVVLRLSVLAQFLQAILSGGILWLYAYGASRQVHYPSKTPMPNS